MFMLILVLVLFSIMLVSSLLLKNLRWISTIHIVGMAGVTAWALKLATIIFRDDCIEFLNGLFYIDSLSLLNLLIISIISLIAVFYSRGYLQSELDEGIIELRRAKLFYVLLSLFVLSMIFVCISNNIVVIWIGLEATTLATAFLIGFDRSKLALEATWKYIIICSIGIGLGLIGIMLMVYAAGADSSSALLHWTYLVDNFHILNPKLLLLAFSFIFIGIGTKAGLAPMHTWLPDAHSEAPSPISAMMSGVLLNLALYVLIRFYILVRYVNGTEKLQYLFITFGCISLVIASFSILKQKNYKRLLAFSSIENMGIISLGFGFGGYLGIFGSLLHGVIHALGKTLLFLVSGNLYNAFHTKRIDKIHGLIKTMPKNSILWIIGMLVITGAPPFASFFSEFSILVEGINKGHYISSGIYVLCLLLVFAAFFNIFIKMIFISKSDTQYEKKDKDNKNLVPLYITLLLIIGTSIYFGGYLTTLINKAVLIITG